MSHPALIRSFVLVTAMIVFPASAYAQESTADRTFTPSTSQALSPEQRLCRASAGEAPMPGTVRTVQAPQEAMPVLVYRPNPITTYALERWMADELVRTGRLSSAMPQAERLATVRRRFDSVAIINALCAHVPRGASCRLTALWRTEFLRDPWCDDIEAGRVPAPTAFNAVEGSLDARICVNDQSPGVYATYLPCPQPDRSVTLRSVSRASVRTPMDEYGAYVGIPPEGCAHGFGLCRDRRTSPPSP